MVRRRIIVLANSYKKSPGRCVAGREQHGDGSFGPWIRPVSDQKEGELLPHHIRTADGACVEPLDIVECPLVSHANDPIHPEDWHIDPAAIWKRIGRLQIDRLADLEERPNDLWMDPATRPDRATPEFLSNCPVRRSLCVIKPADFRVVVTNEFNPFEGHHQGKRRACFGYQGASFALGLTDPLFIDRFVPGFPQPNAGPVTIRPPVPNDRLMLCVSLTPLFNGFHYKIVAAVLGLP